MVVNIKIIEVEYYHVVEINLDGKFYKEIYCPNANIKDTVNCIKHSLEGEDLPIIFY